MKSGKRNLLSIALILLSVAVVLMIAFSNQELASAWDTIGRLDPVWLLGIFLCWGAYTVFDGMNYWCYLCRQGFSISFFRCVHVALIGFYYSNITPSAAGGQPMQVNSMRKAGIPVGYGTMAVTIRFIANQFIISMMSLVLFTANKDFVFSQLGNVMWIIRIGWLINFAAVPVVILAAFMRGWIQGFAVWIIDRLFSVRLIKNRDIAISKVTEVLDTYQTALRAVIRSPFQIFIQLLCSAFSLLGLTGSVIFVYHAFGMTGTSWMQILTISCLLFVSASYTPLPGASGAQEGGFLVYYKNVFTDGTIGLALLVWRFFTFYLFLITGVFTVIAEKMFRKKSRNSEYSREE